VTNLGPDDSALLTLDDNIPSGMTFVSATQDNGPTFSCSAPNSGDTVGTISCSIASLTNGSTADFTFTFHIPPATPPGTVFTNIATVSTATDPNSENDSAVAGTSTPFPPQGDMFVSKSGPTGAAADSDVVYTITIGNAGPDNATNVSMSDTLPGTMTFVSLTQDNGPTMSCTTPSVGTGGVINCTLASFPQGASATFTLTGHIPPGTPSGTDFTNQVTVTSDNDPNSENDTSQTVLVVASADLSVTKTGPANVDAGDDISYTITLSNAGPDAASQASFTDIMPPNTTFVSLNQDNGPLAVCSTPGVGTNGTLSCTINFLNSAQSAQFTLVIEAGNTLSVSNTATATTDSADPNQGNNTSATVVTTVTPIADLGVVKNGPATINAGENIAYTITVTNNGPSNADDVSLTDTTPAGTTFVSATQNTGPTFNCSTPAPGGTGAINCTIATLANGATATFTFVMNVSASTASGTTIGNTANVATTTSDSDSGNDSWTSNATVSVSADLGVTKNGPTSIDAGTDITYTVSLTNNGPSDATTVTLTDNTPANTTFVSATQDSGPVFACGTPAVGGTGPITCTIASFAAGSTANFTFVMHVSGSAPAASNIDNTASVTATSPDPIPGNDSDSSSAIVAAEAELSIAKTGPATADPNTDITYTVTLTNAGPADSLNVELTDPVPANTTFVSATQTTGPAFNCVTPPVGSTGTITCTIAAFPAGSATFDFVFHINAQSAGGTVSNTATVTSPNDPAGGNNASTVATAINGAGIPTLSPFMLALMALSLAGIVLFLRR
jgi:uncharacterized repeat protein (TIGR01451 family)